MRRPATTAPLLALLLTSGVAAAAEVTDVADAFDNTVVGGQLQPNPWDFLITSDWDSYWQTGTIAREPIDRPSVVNPQCNEANSRGCKPVNELTWRRQTVVQNLKLEAGIYHDLSITAELPIVYSDTLHYGYAAGMNASTSTVDTGDPSTSLFAHNFASYHSGLGAMGLGMRWGILSDERDVSKPNWVVFFKWFNPATSHTNRFAATTGPNPGYVGDGIHHLLFGMALSKRLGNFGNIGIDDALPRRGFTEPYVEFSYSIPMPAKGRAINSLFPSAGNPFGDKSSQVGRVKAGLEVVAYENQALGRKVAIDIGMKAAYFTEARNYTALSDPLQRATFAEQYMNVTGYLGVYATPVRYVKLKLGVGFGFDSEHWLTNEIVGRDTNGDGRVTTPQFDPNPVKDQLNPYYCGNSPNDVCTVKNLPSFDQAGFRFRDTAHSTITGSFSAIVQF